MMELRRKIEIGVETREVLVLNRGRNEAFGRDGGGQVKAVRPEVAAVVPGLSLGAVCRQHEVCGPYFKETEPGLLLIGLKSIIGNHHMGY